MMWGIAETTPLTALKIYRDLDKPDQQETVWNMTNAIIQRNGLSALTPVLDQATPEEKETFLKSVQHHAQHAPPSEYFAAMARHLPSAPFLTSSFSKVAARWAATDPEKALLWAQQNASSPDTAAASIIMAHALQQKR